MNPAYGSSRRLWWLTPNEATQNSEWSRAVVGDRHRLPGRTDTEHPVGGRDAKPHHRETQPPAP